MGERTGISWADATFNPWIGCTKVSPGCDHCYAERDMAIRRGRVQWGAGAARSRTSEAYWKQPLTWNRKAQASGQPWRVFCASLADVFDNEVPHEWRADLWQLIEATPHLTWMLLTKRIGNALRMLPIYRLPNVWLGITVVDQPEAERDVPKLLALNESVLRWLSIEPLLGPVDLTAITTESGETWNALDQVEADDALVEGGCSGVIDWVIVGGESGPGARPMNVEWVRSLRDQCARHDVPFHFKQWGGPRPTDGGHLLDGREHREFPRT